jgi:hypothetical protein
LRAASTVSPPGESHQTDSLCFTDGAPFIPVSELLPQAGAAGKDESEQPNVFTSGEIQRRAGLIQRNLRWNFFWIALTGALFEFGAAFADAACRRSCTAPPSWA